MRSVNKHKRSRAGHSMIELGCVALLLVIVCLISADVGILMLADSTNERAARDAARAAAGASDSATGLTMAQAAVATHGVSNSPFISKPRVMTSEYIYQDFGGSPPPNTSPYVEVTTQIDVKLPAPIFFASAKLDMKSSNGRLVLRKRYHFPIIKTKLYLNG